MQDKKSTLLAVLRRDPWILLLLVLGLALLLLPESGRSREDAATDYELRLSAALGQMEGVGEVRVLLSGGESRGRAFTGAVIVCQGANSPSVRLRVVQATAAFTALGTDRIIVEKMR